MWEGFGPPFYLEIKMEHDEDGITILYNVFKDGKKVGDFKILSLGIAHIKRVTDIYNFDISRYSIRRIKDNALVWDGSTVSESTRHVSVD